MIFTFLNLPGEIRNVIYEELLIVPNPIKIIFIGDSNGTLTLTAATHPTTLSLASSISVLRVCRQIYKEAAAVLYSRNAFSIKEYHDHWRKWTDSHAIIDFIFTIGLSNARHLQHLAIPYPRVCMDGTIGAEVVRAFAVLRTRCPALHTLEFKPSVTRYSTLKQGSKLDWYVQRFHTRMNFIQKELETIPWLRNIILEAGFRIELEPLQSLAEEYAFETRLEKTPITAPCLIAFRKSIINHPLY